jgi:Golgi phosphoprotein 3 (GPP34)
VTGWPGRVIVVAMDELPLDLLLLAVRPDGTLVIPEKLRYGLAGSELIRLAAARRVDIVRGRIVVINTARTSDPLLDEALASMAAGRREQAAKAWVARYRRGLAERYIARAESAGIIRADRRKALGFIPVTRWSVADTARAAQARARLEAAAAGTGAADPAQAALAGLASAIDVTRFVFPGRAGSAARKRLREAAKREPAAAGVTQAVTGAAAGSVAAPVTAATDAATRAAVDAAVRAATDAAVNAAVDAATQAAVSAAPDAAHHASGHGGAAGGHH